MDSKNFSAVHNIRSKSFFLHTNFSIFRVTRFLFLPFVPSIVYYRFGRKVMLFGAQFVAGIALLATTLVPDGKFEHNWPIVALCWIGTVFCTVAFSCSYTATKELFPTPLRYL